MDRAIREIKTDAKRALSGKYGLAIMGMLAVTGITVLGSRLASALFKGDSLYVLIVSQVFLFVFSLVMSVFTAGLSYMYMNMARGREYSLGDLLYFFRRHPDRVIIAGFVLAVIDTIVSIPYYYMSFQPVSGLAQEELLARMEQLLGLLLLSVALNVLLTLPFVFCYYLMADDLEMGGFEALKTSARMMKGHMWKYLLLQISFIPLLFLSMFTLYIALLWLVPYIQMCSVIFYLDVLELSRTAAREELPEKETYTGDDFNAEA